MLIFAWILWSALLGYGTIRAILFIGAAISEDYSPLNSNYSSIEKINLDLRPMNTLLKIAAFVFLSILLFGGYLS